MTATLIHYLLAIIFIGQFVGKFYHAKIFSGFFILTVMRIVRECHSHVTNAIDLVDSSFRSIGNITRITLYVRMSCCRQNLNIYGYARTYR